MRLLFTLTVALLITSCSITPAHAALEQLGKTKLFGPIPEGSQYSPYILHQPGWEGYLMYYCKNTPINGVWRDRVWRIQQYGDGITSGNWITDEMMLEGSDGALDDLSCSPSVVFDASSVWHMYYLTALRTKECNLHIYHATSTAPGTTWTKNGEIIGANFPEGCYENPSPMFLNNKIILYISGGVEQGLWRAESNDGHTFTPFIRVIAPPNLGSGGVRYHNGVYYFAYSRSTAGAFSPPNQLYLTSSTNGMQFPEGQLIAQSTSSDWDGTYMWNPTLYLDGPIIRVYYAGTLGQQPRWGSNGSIGVRWFTQISPTPSPTPLPPTNTPIPPTPTPSLTPSPPPGDQDADRDVDFADLNLLLQQFGIPKSLFDYAKVVWKYGIL